jgi:hypothetical protein
MPNEVGPRPPFFNARWQSRKYVTPTSDRDVLDSLEVGPLIPYDMY